MAASSSHHLLSAYAPTSAPPPTPSSQANPSACSDVAADTLSRLLHRLPPALSLPTRVSPRAVAKATAQTTATPLLTLSDLSPETIASTSDAGFFQLAADCHRISPQLAESAESESLSLLALSRDRKLKCFPSEWPLGLDEEDEEDAGDETTSFCLDGAFSTNAEGEELGLGLGLVSLREMSEKLETVGMEVVKSLAHAVGFENPFEKRGSDGPGPATLMWVSSDGDKGGRVYPYVVGLQYQIRARKYSLLSDSDTVVVEPNVGSVLVTLGDIAQVWSNGKIKKVRGRPTPIISEEKTSNNSHCISMTLLLTLPIETTVLPLTPALKTKTSDQNESEIEVSDFKQSEKNTLYDKQSVDNGTSIEDEDQRKFVSFSFEDYAWRVYHERLLLKDPLDRYRVKHD